MQRSTVNTILAVSGGLTILSGLFLLFHYESSLIKAVHEIGALVMALCFIPHLKANWKSFKSSFPNKTKVYAIAAVFALAIMVMAATGAHYDEETFIKARCPQQWPDGSKPEI